MHASSLAIAVLLFAACSPSSLVEVNAPNKIIDPSQVATPSGATQLYSSAIAWIDVPLAGEGFGSDLVSGIGLFTDELAETGRSRIGIDERTVFLPANTSNTTGQMYHDLHQARVQMQQARQALQLYAPSAPKAWQGQLLALEGYTVLYFAENFCSGIPLTAVPLVGPQVPTAGLTTQELYTRALALFDSALVVGTDSAQFMNFASVGKGRALLELGRFADAATAVRDVPTSFVYLAQFNSNVNNRLSFQGSPNYRAQDNEGINGLVWSTDPRTAIVVTPALSGTMLRPSKYYVTAAGVLDPNTAQLFSPIRVADGLEARLIEAEAALAAGNASWLTTLNTLRSTCVGTAACAPVPGLTAAALPPLTDPGTAAAQLNLMMKERAMWLYMTGHREADLRRLAHVYQRDPNTLWPTGAIAAPAFPPVYTTPLPSDGTFYGADVVFAPNANEQLYNPLYGGCYDLNP